MDYPVLVALAVLGLVTLVSGLALLLVGRARVSAALLAISGSSMVAATLFEAGDRPTIADPLFVGYVLALGVATMTYPVARWRHPVDFVALVVVSASGLLSVAQPRNAEVLGSLGIVGALTVGAHAWGRLERAVPPERLSLIWLASTLAVVGVVSGLTFFLTEAAGGATIGTTIWAVLPPVMYLGTVRPELVDVRGLLVRAVVVLVAVIGYMSVFVTLESLLEVLGSETPSVGVLAFVGAVAAITFHPLQVVLRGVVDALLFGVRPDPLGAAAQMADQIGDDPEQALRAIRAALVLPYAALEVDGATVAASGSLVTHTREIPLTPGGDGVGRAPHGALVVGLRPGDLGLGDDEAVLKLVGPILGQTLRARALAADLRASRADAVVALEEERRRLRRDLHDGLGPRLSGIAFTADAARNSVRTDPELAEQLLSDLRADTTTAISDVRELVYGMRPPALDELGLLGALRQQAASLRAFDGTPLTVEIEAPSLPALGAAVEVAAYRIIVEALTNVARHSGSVRASVKLDVGPQGLGIEVLDGAGPPLDKAAPWPVGVGISAMRERAAEVGGSLVAEPSPTGGRVRAVLPLPLPDV